MKKVPPETLFLPQKESRIVCGGTLVEWDYAVVYVYPKMRPHEAPTHMYFTFLGSGDYYLDEVMKLVDQWTYRRGTCLFVVAEGTHEYYRAKKMACDVVATYRKNYLKEYGQPPNPLCLTGTLNENLIKKIMLKRRKYPAFTEQYKLELDEP
ncbi:MAG: hypothetical protein V4606_03090 [Patescibacteria group bacterium]